MLNYMKRHRRKRKINFSCDGWEHGFFFYICTFHHCDSNFMMLQGATAYSNITLSNFYIPDDTMVIIHKNLNPKIINEILKLASFILIIYKSEENIILMLRLSH